MALLYKGYAQEKGFKPIQVADASQKIRQQGLDAMKGMQRVIDWNAQQAKLHADHRAGNAQLLLETREKSWKLKQDFRDTVQEAQKNKQERILKNAETSAKNTQQHWKDILSITESGTQLIQQFDAQLKENAALWAQQWYEDHGITGKEFHAVREVDDHIWNKSKTELSVYRDLRKRGVDDNAIEQMRRMGGYRKVAVEKLAAVNMMQDRRGFYAQNEHTEFTVLGQSTSLAKAKFSGDTTLLREVLRQLDLKAIKEYGAGYPSAKILKSSGALEIKREVHAEIFGQVEKTTRARNKSRAMSDELTILDAEIKNTIDLVGNDAKYGDAGKAVQGWIERQQGDNPTREQRVGGTDYSVEMLAYGLENGLVQVETVKALLNSNIIPHGSTKEVKWGSHFKRHSFKLWTAIKKAEEFEQGKLLSQEGVYKREGKQMHLDYIRILNESNPSMEQLIQLQHKAKEHSHGSQALMLINSRIANFNNTLNDDQGIAWIKHEIANNRFVTEPDVLSLKLSDAGQAEAIQLVQASNPFVPTGGDDGTAAAITNHVTKVLEQTIPKGTHWGNTYSRQPAIDRAVALVNAEYVEATKSGMPHTKALNHALGIMHPIITDPNGDWGRSTPKPGHGIQFKGFMIQSLSAEDRIVVDTPRIQKECNANLNTLYTNPYLDKEQLIHKSSKLNKGYAQEIIPRAMLLSNLCGNKLTARQIENAQLEFWRNEEIKETGKSDIQTYPDWYLKDGEEVDHWVLPLANQYLDGNPEAPTAINKAVLLNPEQPRPPVYNQYLKERTVALDLSDEPLTPAQTLWQQSAQELVASDKIDLKKYGFYHPGLLDPDGIAYMLLFNSGFYNRGNYATV